MTAVSIQAYQGQVYKNTDFAVGTAAPTSEDFEFRFNLLNQNSKNIQRMDIILFLRNLIFFLETGGATVQLTNGMGGATTPSPTAV